MKTDSAAAAKMASIDQTPGARMNGPVQSLPGDEVAPPCTLVIFGAGGDLTKRLLMPALYNLSGSHLLDERLQIVGVDHGDNSDEGWRTSLTETMQSFTTDFDSGISRRTYRSGGVVLD